MTEFLTENIEHLERQYMIILVLWVIPLLAYIIDLWTGIEGAKAQREKLHSKGFRKTIIKIGEYWRFQLMALLIDIVGMFIPQYNLPYISMIATISIIFIEFISVRENFKKKKSSTISAISVAETLLSEIVKANTKYDAEKIIEKLKNSNIDNEKDK